jgi:hypothetical protein
MSILFRARCVGAEAIGMPPVFTRWYPFVHDISKEQREKADIIYIACNCNIQKYVDSSESSLIITPRFTTLALPLLSERLCPLTPLSRLAPPLISHSPYMLLFDNWRLVPRWPSCRMINHPFIRMLDNRLCTWCQSTRTRVAGFYS